MARSKRSKVKEEDMEVDEGEVLGASGSRATRARRGGVLDSDDDGEDDKKGVAKKEKPLTARQRAKIKSDQEEEERKRKKEEEATLRRDKEERGARPLTQSLDHQGGKYSPMFLKFDETDETADEGLTGVVDVDGKDLVEKGGGFVLFQFPTILPPRMKQGSGKVGKLRVYDDGSAELDVGGVTLEVFPGTLSDCFHQVAMMSTKEDKCVFLGNVTNKQVCTPKLDDV
ncbi:hypothetical protein HOP50_07g46870 [Chloropicon primus]|uniref:DNA-directed RNA polymerase III subunit RPC4 n=1 Tax=Chloropicon primus TaxID=1764295 RepID=A0A5B8MP14_9CHLO|nr:hypothetical protein A3770_07p46650 [Chloropicon primus]UPR01365.1 hypothetical protein HOP50_07g46870 [Chloropicon primus]|eukprot:QDZ22147.1 hypothetical protein A3770_07p46650 [Chloropicon primus]